MTSSEIDAPQLCEAREPTPESDVTTTAEAPPVILEPEIVSAAEIIEIEPFECEATPEQVATVPELAEVQQIVPEAAPSETQQAAPEAVYSVPEMPQTLPEPETVSAAEAIEIEPLEVEATPEQVEAVPELAEVQQIVPEAAPSETQQAALELCTPFRKCRRTCRSRRSSRLRKPSRLSLLKLKRLQNRLKQFPSSQKFSRLFRKPRLERRSRRRWILCTPFQRNAADLAGAGDRFGCASHRDRALL